MLGKTDDEGNNYHYLDVFYVVDYMEKRYLTQSFDKCRYVDALQLPIRFVLIINSTSKLFPVILSSQRLTQHSPIFLFTRLKHQLKIGTIIDKMKSE